MYPLESIVKSNGKTAPRQTHQPVTSNPWDHSLLVTRHALEQADDASRCQIEVHVVEHRPCRQPRHGAHLAAQRVEEACAHTGPDVAYREDVVLRPPLQRRVVAQAQVRLRHADRQLVEAQPRETARSGPPPPACSWTLPAP